MNYIYIYICVSIIIYIYVFQLYIYICVSEWVKDFEDILMGSRAHKQNMDLFCKRDPIFGGLIRKRDLYFCYF